MSRGGAAPDSQTAKTATHFPGPDSTTVAALRKGDLVLVFRHAQTDWGQRDADVANFADRSAQRNLSAAGDSMAARVGRAIRKLEIPIGEVLASPMWRCRDTATLAFGHCDTTITLFRRSAMDRAARVAYLGTPITDGKNLVLVTHQDVLIPIITGLKREELKEGDAFVVRPQGDGKFDILAQVTPDDWERLAAQDTR
jgi:phosphohistidine phosphatase SixA